MIIDNIENKRKILRNFLEIAIFEGVNQESFEKSFEKSEISKKYSKIIFENGILSLIEFYLDEIIQEIALEIEKNPDFQNLKIRQKIQFVLYKFFEIQKNDKISVQRIFNFYFDIKNFTNNYNAKPLFSSFKNLLKISDKMWFLIKDKSTDFNFYTKRLTLAKILFRAFSVFVKDESENLQKTKNFIDSEIEKVMKFEKLKAKFKEKIKDFDFLNKNSKIKECFNEFFLDENLKFKKPQEIIKNLPFIRLLK